MNILMCIDLLNNEIVTSADLNAAKCLRRDLPNKEWSQHIRNMFRMFPLLNKKFRKCIQCRNVFDVKGLKGEWFLK